ncbi:MAG: alpha-amylase family glycosyl hydrolase [Candidatus Eisenbacteria bacterium]
MSDAHWYTDAVFAHVRVRSFRDGNGDGVGDFAGLREALPYLESLGITAIWLMPMYPSPLVDDGYDVADYTAIHPDLGTLADFDAFVAAAHARGMRVVADLVLNHTSDEHPWFVESRASRESERRDWYVWSDSDAKYAGVHRMFEGAETSNWAWDEGTRQWWWHRFYARQPDLNWDHPAVMDAMFEVMAFWCERGVDGFRVDAVPYLVEREGTSCENLPETHAVMRELRRRLDARFADRVLIGEAGMQPRDLRAYFGDGDECHMAFQFALAPALLLALARADRTPLDRLLAATPALPAGGQWALFLRSHDELTLAFLPTPERDELLAAYAPGPHDRLWRGIRRRLLPLLGGDVRRARLLFSLLFALPGTPFLYYGDELGMGDDPTRPDRDGLRLPMPWDEAAAQDADPGSLLNAVRALARERARLGVFGRGACDALELPGETAAVFACVRTLGEQRVVVLANFAAAPASVAVGGREVALGPYAYEWLEIPPGAPLR